MFASVHTRTPFFPLCFCWDVQAALIFLHSLYSPHPVSCWVPFKTSGSCIQILVTPGAHKKMNLGAVSVSVTAPWRYCLMVLPQLASSFGPQSLLPLALLFFFSAYAVHSIHSPSLPPFRHLPESWPYCVLRASWPARISHSRLFDISSPGSPFNLMLTSFLCAKDLNYAFSDPWVDSSGKGQKLSPLFLLRRPSIRYFPFLGVSDRSPTSANVLCWVTSHTCFSLETERL